MFFPKKIDLPTQFSYSFAHATQFLFLSWPYQFNLGHHILATVCYKSSESHPQNQHIHYVKAETDQNFRFWVSYRYTTKATWVPKCTYWLSVFLITFITMSTTTLLMSIGNVFKVLVLSLLPNFSCYRPACIPCSLIEYYF